MLTQVSSDEPNENRHLADCNGNACMIRIFSTHTGKSRAVEDARKACVMVIISTNRIDLKTSMMKSHDPWIFISVVMQSLFFTVFATSATKKCEGPFAPKEKKLAENLLMFVSMVAFVGFVPARRCYAATNETPPCSSDRARAALRCSCCSTTAQLAWKERGSAVSFLTMILQERVYFLQLFPGQVHAQHEHQQVRRKSGA